MGRPRIYTDEERKERAKKSIKKYKQNNKLKIYEYELKYRKTQMSRAQHLFQRYKQSDKEANRGECTLNAKWIVENIFTQPCAHCGESDWHNIGCNRLDNSKPHTPDNVEPCCRQCNLTLQGTQSKRVYQYTLDGLLIAIWESACRAAKQLSICHSHIIECCNGKLKAYKGYIWSYVQL